MTRINCIPVQELARLHLISEYKELPRSRHFQIKDRILPDTYRLGTGHCLFFHDKGLYLEKRHKALIAEMQKRNYQTNVPPLNLSHWPESAMNDWTPNEQDMVINRERIAERIIKNKIST